jgi:pilus assembly protein CpaB
MNLRLVVIGVLLIVAALAFYILSGDPESPSPEVVAPAPKSDLDEILVAAREIPPGLVISDLDLKWIAFPISALRPGMIARSTEPSASQTLKGSYARVPHLEGEPIRREKLVRTSGAGFISAILPSGMRGMAISIDPNGLTTAGGFILPNDRVDVMRIVRLGDSTRAEVVLSDVRVIAIGRNIQDPQGPDRTIQGGTATLEVTPQQARALAVAQQVAGLFLVLRSLQDAGRDTPEEQKSSLTIIRHGAPITLGR